MIKQTQEQDSSVRITKLHCKQQMLCCSLIHNSVKFVDLDTKRAIPLLINEITKNYPANQGSPFGSFGILVTRLYIVGLLLSQFMPYVPLLGILLKYNLNKR